MYAAALYRRWTLAIVAFGLVAGPGLVTASSPTTYPAPRSGVLIGPSSVLHGGIGTYSLSVTFTDLSTGTFNGVPAKFTAISSAGPAGSFVSGTSTYLAPSTANARVILTAGYVNTNGALTVNRVISVD
jgi:hypothetical protein